MDKKFEPFDEKFFESPPEEGSEEMAEAKKEAGVVNWIDAAKRRIEFAKEIGDQKLLENTMQFFASEIGHEVPALLDRGEFKKSKEMLDHIEKLAKESGVDDLDECLKNAQENIKSYNISRIEKLTLDEICDLVNKVLSSGEGPINSTDAGLIKKMAVKRIKNGENIDWEGALIEATIKRLEAKPKHGTIMIAVDAREEARVIKNLEDIIRLSNELKE